MKRKTCCCDASRDMYDDYYSRKVGGEIPVFKGSRYQRGHGLGSVLGGLFRRFVIPLFTTHGKTLALNALRTGVDVAEDVLGSGKTLKESAKKRVPEGIKRTAQNLIHQSQSGAGGDNNSDTQEKKWKKKVAGKKKKKTRLNDIFA